MAKEKRIPLYMQIQEYFIEQITKKHLNPHDKIPSEIELMEKFHVSRITVVNALSNLAKDGWIYRVPGRGSFVQKIGKDEHEEKETDRASTDEKPTVGLLMPTMEDFFAIRLFRGISKTLGNQFHLVLMLTDNSKARERELIKKLMDMGAVGLLIFPVDQETYNEEILALKVNEFPFVLLDRYLPGVETNCVYTDGCRGSRMAVSHLYELGHREIVVCTDALTPTVTVEDRIKGYMDELKTRGELINPSLILKDLKIDHSKIDEQNPLFRSVKDRLGTAYITLNGRLGYHVYRGVQKLGLRVPEDVSILTFDDPFFRYEDFSDFTHISQSEEEMGVKAAEILIHLLTKSQSVRNYRKVVLEPRLVVGKTTGPVSTTSVRTN